MTQPLGVAVLIGQLVGITLALWLARWFRRDRSRTEASALVWIFLAIAAAIAIGTVVPLFGGSDRTALMLRLTLIDTAMATLAVALIPTNGRGKRGTVRD